MNSHFLCYVIFILRIFMISATGQINMNKLLNISIYFTSLCPGSRHFITQQLFPSYEGLQQRIKIDWVLYQQRMEYAHTKFFCKHGLEECHYNRYIACALDQRRAQAQDVHLINCIMYNYDFKNCLTQFGYSWSDYEKCITQKRGYKILENHSDRIDRIRIKRISYLPAVIYNNNDRENLDHQSLKTFRQTVCSKLVSPLPSICY